MILRKAEENELDQIWEIIQYAIEKRKEEGSKQWQDGYPNPDSIQQDFERGYAYVIELDGEILLYAAIIFDVEPAYEELKDGWLNNEPYLVVHRVAVSPNGKGKSLGTELFKLLENLAKENGYYNVKVDTNFDNISMLRILEKLEYKYCGEVFFRGASRKAFQKVISPN